MIKFPKIEEVKVITEANSFDRSMAKIVEVSNTIAETIMKKANKGQNSMVYLIGTDEINIIDSVIESLIACGYTVNKYHTTLLIEWK